MSGNSFRIVNAAYYIFSVPSIQKTTDFGGGKLLKMQLSYTMLNLESRDSNSRNIAISQKNYFKLNFYFVKQRSDIFRDHTASFQFSNDIFYY